MFLVYFRKQQMSKKNKKVFNVDAEGNPVIPFVDNPYNKMSKRVEAKTPGQQRYIDAIYNNDIVLCNGVWGSGKTHISIAIGIEYLRMGKVDKIIISRPAVSACGEEQGFYPGDYKDKIAPYLIPLQEEMKYYASNQEIKGWVEKGTISFMPIGLLRGQNWNRTFVVIDECANLTFNQVELILSRFGQNSKLVMSADFNQSDLPHYKRGGFRAFFEILDGMSGVGICHLGKEDVVRSDFVKEMLDRIALFRGENTKVVQEKKENFLKY